MSSDAGRRPAPDRTGGRDRRGARSLVQRRRAPTTRRGRARRTPRRRGDAAGRRPRRGGDGNGGPCRRPPPGRSSRRSGGYGQGHGDRGTHGPGTGEHEAGTARRQVQRLAVLLVDDRRQCDDDTGVRSSLPSADDDLHDVDQRDDADEGGTEGDEPAEGGERRQQVRIDQRGGAGQHGDVDRHQREGREPQSAQRSDARRRAGPCSGRSVAGSCEIGADGPPTLTDPVAPSSCAGRERAARPCGHPVHRERCCDPERHGHRDGLGGGEQRDDDESHAARSWRMLRRCVSASASRARRSGSSQRQGTVAQPITRCRRRSSR